MKIFARLADVREEKSPPSIFFFFFFFLITSTAYIIKPVKTSLFLEWLSFENLPLAYLLTAFLIGFVVTLNSRLLKTVDRHLYISISLAFFIANLLVFRWLFTIDWKWLSLLLWFWADIFTATSVTQFWILVNDTYKPHQARRLVGFLVSGGLSGGITGALAAGLLVRVFKTEDLLLAGPVLLAGCLVLVVFLRRSRREKDKAEDREGVAEKREKIRYATSFRMFVKNRHLVLLSGIMASTIIVTTLVDFQFNHVLQKNFADKDARTAFLGFFYALLLILSYLFHVLATNRVLKNFGIRAALMITPIILLIGSVAVFIVPIAALIYWIVFLKGADKGLAHSLSQSVRELLYIPVSPEVKHKAKVFIDMFVNKFAKGFAACLLLLFFSLLKFSFSVRLISLTVVFFIFIWIALNRMITKEYVGIVKKNLRIKWQDTNNFIKEKMDVDMTRLVFDTIQKKNRSSVLYAMNLFDLIKSERLSPELKKIISGKCDEIKAYSMDSLLELDGEVLLPEMDDAIEDELDSQVKEIMSLDVYQELMREQIDRIIRRESEEEDIAKMEAAKVIGMMAPSSLFIPQLEELLKDDSPEVFQYAAESAVKYNKRQFVHNIIDRLKKTATRRVAGQALVEYGGKILGTLKDYLGDGEEDLRIRKAIPDIMFRVGTQRAADIMAMELRKGSVDVESELVEAMFKLRNKDPGIRFQPRYIKPEILSLVKKSYLILLESHDLMSDEKKANLVSDLEGSLAGSLKKIFELLSLIYPLGDILEAYRNLTSGGKKSIGDSCELLDNILKKEMKDFVFPLIEDIPFEDKLKRCRKMLKELEKSETA